MLVTGPKKTKKIIIQILLVKFLSYFLGMFIRYSVKRGGKGLDPNYIIIVLFYVLFALNIFYCDNLGYKKRTITNSANSW